MQVLSASTVVIAVGDVTYSPYTRVMFFAYWNSMSRHKKLWYFLNKIQAKTEIDWKLSGDRPPF